jgi:apolipoprotein N-acyltransferase
MKKQWLLIIPGIVLLYFSNGRFGTALATWLFPVFLLFVSRHTATRYSIFLFPLMVAITLQAAFWKFTSSNPANILFYIPFFAGLVFGFIFYADRLFVRRNARFSGTLFFPLLYTTVDFINSLINPFGTTGVLGYAQHEFLVFAQLAALTGMWGITFMITWVGSLIVWVINKPIKETKKGLIAYCIILAGILLFGTIRLNISLSGETVKVAGIHTTDKERDAKAFWKALAQNDTTSFIQASNSQIENLTQATIEQASKGAKMILWSEVSPTILSTKEIALKEHLQQLSKQLQIYLIANPYLTATNGTKPENKIWMFSPEGELILTHYKYGGNFIEGSVEGDKKLKLITTPFGNMSGLICWDADFPAIAKQLGKMGADIVFNPASDWKEIDPLHTRVAIFRAIENGCSWVRQTRNGLSVITDPRGKIIAEMDHFKTTEWVNTANVPNKRLWTLYPSIGDLFGWLAIIALVFLLSKSYFKKQVNV